MASDYYKTLEVERTASAEEIRKSYRNLARKYHPDLHPDDANAKKKFQEVQEAFDVLNDEKKREQYDRYGSNYEAFQGGGHGGRHGAGASPWGGGTPGGGQGFDFDFEELFGNQAGRGGQPTGPGSQPGGFGDFFKQFTGGGGNARPKQQAVAADIQTELTVPFSVAVLGGQAQIAVQRPSGKVENITVTIPEGIEDGKKIRLRGQGEPANRRGKAGDLLITIHVSAHPVFTRKGKRLEVKVPVTLAEAISGAPVDIPTPSGTITLTLPKGTSSGKKLRIKGHGVKTKQEEPGDLYAEIEIILPADISDKDRETIAEIDKKYNQNPRTDLKW